jgi:hypothetical protein
MLRWSRFASPHHNNCSRRDVASRAAELGAVALPMLNFNMVKRHPKAPIALNCWRFA